MGNSGPFTCIKQLSLDVYKRQAENIEGIEVKKEAGGKGEIYITTKKTKAVEKTSVQGNMKVEGKVAVSYTHLDGMDGEVEFVGDGFVGHALHNAGDDFLFALAQGFLFAVFCLFLLGV